MLYVGVDAHKKTSHFTVMDEKGTVLKAKNVESSPEGVNEALAAFHGKRMKAVIEASYSWGPMYDLLSEATDEVVLAHPVQVKAIANARIKTDSIDSRILAHLLRADLIPEAYAPSKEVRALKRVLRQRMFFVKLRTMFKNRISALLAQHHIDKPKLSDLFGSEGMTWLGNVRLPEPDGAILGEDLSLVKTLNERIKATEGLLKRLSAGDKAVEWLRSLPGVGRFLSVLIRYEVADMTRFPSAKKFASYTGLVPSTYGSAERLFHGRLTKQGNKWLRWGLVEAVTAAIRVSPRLRRYYDRIKHRRGAKDARTATARKLAELVWVVWTEQRCYYE
jgi:transposase